MKGVHHGAWDKAYGSSTTTSCAPRAKATQGSSSIVYCPLLILRRATYRVVVITTAESTSSPPPPPPPKTHTTKPRPFLTSFSTFLYRVPFPTLPMRGINPHPVIDGCYEGLSRNHLQVLVVWSYKKNSPNECPCRRPSPRFIAHLLTYHVGRAHTTNPPCPIQNGCSVQKTEYQNRVRKVIGLTVSNPFCFAQKRV